MPIIETEIWKPNPERPGTIIFDSQRIAQDVFTELEAHLKADGRLPDEYFLFDSNGNWRNGALFPKDGEILCNVNYGGSEGIYLDIAVKYEKDVYEHSRDNGVLDWHKRMVTEHFATGKTLGDSIEDLDRMNLVASSVMAAFYGSKAQVIERYANIEAGQERRIYPIPPVEQKAADVPVHEETVKTSKTIYGDVQPGDWVISAGNSDYGYLIGTVTAIEKLGTPEHDTENETDDVHVDFTVFEYPPERISEIEEHFSGLYDEPKTFDELPLDDVIMAPGELISISNLSHDEITRMGNLRQNCEAFCNCFPGAGEPQSDLHAELIKRVGKNLTDYHSSLMDFGKREIIDMAGKTAAMKDVHDYMTTTHGFDDDEIQFYLQFQNPLEVVADAWLERNADNEDLCFTMDFVFDQKDALVDYPLMNDSAVTAEPPHIEFVGREAKQAYNMGAAEFEKLMYGLLPDASLTAMMNWKGYAGTLEANGTHTKAEFFLEMFIEFDLVKQHYGEKIAMKLFDYAEHFTLNPFEVRGAANHLRDGKHISEIADLTVEGVCDRTSQEWNESEQATRAFIANEGKYKRSEKADHEQAAQSTPEKPPAVPQKRSLGDKLQAAGEKVKAQNAQDNKNKSRKREERE